MIFRSLKWGVAVATGAMLLGGVLPGPEVLLAKSKTERGVKMKDASVEELSRYGRRARPSFGYVPRWAANRFAQKQGAFAAGAWVGEVGKKGDCGIACIAENACKVQDLVIKGPERSSRVKNLAKRVDKFARSEGFVGGFWNGEEVFKDGKLHLGVVCVREGFAERRKVSTGTLERIRDAHYGLRRDRVWLEFSLHRWSGLPGDNYPDYVTGIPLYVEDTKEGEVVFALCFFD